MGKVLIIKNNNIDTRINEFANRSYKENKKYYYNTVDGTLNGQALKDWKEKFDGNGIVLMITYENSDSKEIRDVFIGSDVNINENNNIEYIMKVHLTSENHQRTINSIVDKIDLDLEADFGFGHYVIMSEMESLFQELHETWILGLT